MITGSVLFSFCLFMLSITKEGQFYQIFLTQGVGLGLAVGLLYVPALGVISQYFLRRRPFVLGIGTSVCAGLVTDLSRSYVYIAGISPRWNAPSHHAEQMVPWIPWIPRWRSGKCRVDHRSSDCLPSSHEAAQSAQERSRPRSSFSSQDILA
jgi:hypothetical protein